MSTPVTSKGRQGADKKTLVCTLQTIKLHSKMKKPAHLLFLPETNVPLMQNTEAGDYFLSSRFFL